MACVSQTWSHYVNQIGKTQSKSLAAWERHDMCELALIVSLVADSLYYLGQRPTKIKNIKYFKVTVIFTTDYAYIWVSMYTNDTEVATYDNLQLYVRTSSL
jgi:hypothetical protein